MFEVDKALPLQSTVGYFSVTRPTLVARIYGVVRLCNYHSFLQNYGIKHSRSLSAFPRAESRALRSLSNEVQLVSDSKHIFYLCKMT